jgi:hypothetical protein
MWNRVLKFAFGVMLIPFCLGFTVQLAAIVTSITYKRDAPYYFVLGGLTYLTAHILFKKPILAYVFGHELTHALFAVLFGGSVRSFHASDRGGRVTITKSNFVITLAPYFFPLYTFVALLFYWLAGAADVRGAEGWLVFVSGATYSFHLALTFAFLRTDQDDIKEQGALFSYPLIYLFNMIFVAFLLRVLITEDMNYLRFLGGGILKSTEILSLAFKTGYRAMHGAAL